MKTLQTLLLSALFLMGGMTANADNSNDLIYNQEEVNGVMVGETVYKKEGNMLVNYMKYSYTYDDQKRMTESEAQKWNSVENKWENDIRICHTYKGKTVTTEYYKWNDEKNAYVLAPEMTVTMDVAM